MSSQERTDHARVANPLVLFWAPLVLGIVLSAFFFVPFLPIDVARVAGAVLVAASLLVGGSAFAAMRRAKTSANVYRPTTRIVETGIYGRSRNPIYLSFFVTYAGIAVFLESLWALVLLPFVFVATSALVVSGEEQYLERTFGEEYLRYKARVPRWI